MSDGQSPPGSGTVSRRVAICIATYRRPRSLVRLLESLAALRFRKSAVELAVVVVDNDEDGTAREVAERLREGFPWPLIYEVEPRRNISLARNRAVEMGLRSEAELFAFIDDDEVAAPEWLDELVDVHKQYAADAVGGAVVPSFDDDVPGWVVTGGFFEIPRAATGSEVAMAFTGNALVTRRWLEDPSRRFDPAFGLAGGEDSLFFSRLRQAGGRIVWADEAIVEEAVPLSRANARWILTRAYRVGSCTALLERAVHPGRRWLLPRLAKAVGRIAEGSILLLPASFNGRESVVGSLRKIAHGCGCLAGIARIRYREYEVVHGS